MNMTAIKSKIKEMSSSNSTLLWLHGSKYNCVQRVSIQQNKILLTLEENITHIICYEKYAFTKIGIQFWNKGKASVLYKWDLVPKVFPTQQEQHIPTETHSENLYL